MFRGRFGSIDWFLVVPVVFLITVSLIILNTLASSGAPISLTTQVLAVVLGAGIATYLARSPDEFLKGVSWPLMILSVVLLIAVLLIGTTVGGSQRWLNLGVILFQPSELAKLAVILVTAKYLAENTATVSAGWGSLVRLGLMVLPVMFLTLVQPDLGTSLVYIVIVFFMLLVSTFSLTKIGLVVGLAVVLGGLSYPQLAPYQQSRLTAFVNPSADPLGSGYNVIQSTIAVGSGGATGQGLTGGKQSQYKFLPEAQTDFIFSVIAEKLGFMGAGAVVLALMALVFRSVSRIWRSNSLYQRYLVIGAVGVLLFQIVINIGMNQGVMPVTGLPLPFVSFGGTHILLEFALLGLILRS